MASINFLPPSWGGTNTSKDYEFLMEGDTILSEPISLAGEHAIDTPSQNLNEPAVRRYVTKVKGRFVDREEVIRPADQLSLTMNVNFGAGLETPLLQRARRGVRTTIAARRVCSDPKQAHVYIWENTIPTPPSRVNAPITIQDVVMAEWQSEMRTEIEHIVKEIGAFGVASLGANAYAIAFLDEECSTAFGKQYSDLVVVGGDGGGSDPLLIRLTNDRFATNVIPTTITAPNGSVGSSVATSGDSILVGFADESRIDAAIATAGGTQFSTDGGVTFALDTNITAPIFAVAKFGGAWLAAGGTASGAPYMGVSTDGLTFTSVTSSEFPATGIFMTLAVDEKSGAVYAGTLNGELFKGVLNGGSLVFTDITSALPGSPASILSAAVIGTDALTVVGGGGYIADSLDGGSTFVRRTSGTTSALHAVVGGLYRTLVAGGSYIAERSLLGDNSFRRVANQNGLTISGTAVGAAFTKERDLNFFAVVVSDGSIIFARDFSPYT
jgi:hypothetical protein